jgi:hypothetical protein
VKKQRQKLLLVRKGVDHIPEQEPGGVLKGGRGLESAC